jgi:pSer/pThr/pTyr-binding forkhead associated (FHA) protein
MAQKTGKFTIVYSDARNTPKVYQKESVFIGRLMSNDIVLDHKTVSRIHAGINFRDSRYELINLSSSGKITLNGRPLGPQKNDILADGDTIQIGPFLMVVNLEDGELSLDIQRQVADRVPEKPVEPKQVRKAAESEDKPGDVLKVFWEKRTREKEDWGTRLRPTEKPKPGKAMFNWKPTRDLRKPWRAGLFVWAIIILGAAGAYAYFRYPSTYAPKPLANPHAAKIEDSKIAVTANGNSCTTCHTLDQPIENSCIRCHSAQEFHVSNTKAHEQAGITCTMCHKEHQGSDFDMKATAVASCAECHNDKNTATYNGKSVRTPHGGSYGYPVVDGVWKWKGLYRETADGIPELKNAATGDKDEQAKLSREFHTVHSYRLKAPDGVKGNKNGLVSCSSCHKSFKPLDVTTPRETCAACHTNAPNAVGRDPRFTAGGVNCISCHVQHPYSADRWSEFLTEDAVARRKDAVTGKIKQMTGQ